MRSDQQPNRRDGKPRKRIRRYINQTNPVRRAVSRMLRWGLLLVSCLMILYSVVGMVRYIRGYALSHLESALLLADYQEGVAISDWPQMTVAPMLTSAPTASPTITPQITPTKAPPTIDLNELATLAPMSYPKNPYRIISSSLRKLRRRNEDIVGWLHIEGMLDEAVVQRDNSYYLRRDYLGYHNQNGALFLDENCNLMYRPYDYIIYGHNMKSGAMFGSLRAYEDLSYYKQHAIVSFDTLYEEGRYVIFSVAQIRIDPGFSNYVPILLLPYSTIKDRIACIRKLQALSQYRTNIEVTEMDQLLFLVTCDGDNTERRIIVARRIRDDEDDAEMKRIIQGAYPQ